MHNNKFSGYYSKVENFCFATCAGELAPTLFIIAYVL